MSVEELERIMAYGAKLEEERREAAKPPPPPPQEPWAKGNGLIFVDDEGAFLNLPMVRKLLLDWRGDLRKLLGACGREVHGLEGGEFIRAEALVAAFDSTGFGRGRKGFLRILKISSMNDVEPKLPVGAVRASQADAPFNAFTGKAFPEPLLDALDRPGRQIPHGLPRGGDQRGVEAKSLEEMGPFEVGVRTDMLNSPVGNFLWIRYLPREEE
jgi:hypothetical protein